MSHLHLVPQTPPAQPDPRAGLDVLRERHAMLAELGHTLEDEDAFVRGELVIAALGFIDESDDPRRQGDRRSLLVRAAALLIADVERLDRAAEKRGSER